MRPAFGQPGAEGQPGLSAVERLHLRLRIHAEYERAIGRAEVEADAVDDLGGKLGVPTVLEGPRLVGRQPVRAPDPMHRRRAQPDLLGAPAHTPMRRKRGRRPERLRQHALHRGIVDRARPARARPVAEPGQPLACELGPPPPDGRQRRGELACDRPVRGSLGGPQDDPRPAPFAFEPITTSADEFYTIEVGLLPGPEAFLDLGVNVGDPNPHRELVINGDPTRCGSDLLMGTHSIARGGRIAQDLVTRNPRRLFIISDVWLTTFLWVFTVAATSHGLRGTKPRFWRAFAWPAARIQSVHDGRTHRNRCRARCNYLERLDRTARLEGGQIGLAWVVDG